MSVIFTLVFISLSGQPLLIIGYTGPLLVFEESLYEFCDSKKVGLNIGIKKNLSFLSATELKFRADYNSTPCVVVGVVVGVGVRVHFKK